MAQLVIPKQLNPLDDVAQMLGIKSAAQGLQLQKQQIAQNQQQAQLSAINTQQQAQLKTLFENPASWGPDGKPTKDALMKVGMIHPATQAELLTAYQMDPKSLSTIQNQQNEIQNRNADNTRADIAASDVQYRNNEEMKRKAAEESAGVTIPGTEFDIKDASGKTQRAARYKVRQPDGSYKEETRMFGELAAPPKIDNLSLDEKTADQWLKEHPGKTLTDYQKYKTGLSNSDEGVLDLSPAGLDAAALTYARTGTLPPMGMAKAGAKVRTEIINRAAAMYPDLDVSANSAEFKANQASLAALQKNRDAVVAFENTANKNLDLFLSTAKPIVDSGSPWANRPLRSVDRNVLGSKDQAAFDAARRVAVNEIAKVTSNPSLSGQLSDSARHEVESFIPAEATLQQVLSVASILKSDMKNRHDSLDEQIGGIQGRIRQKPATGGKAPAAPKADLKNVSTDELLKRLNQ